VEIVGRAGEPAQIGGWVVGAPYAVSW